MSKLKKLITVLLSLILLVTSFAVVSLAADGETVEKQNGLLRYYDFQGGEVGSTTYEANVAGTGEFLVAESINGNKYVKHTVVAGTGNASYLSGPYLGNTKYSLTDYPYCAIDFDIMKIAGDYAGASFDALYYANGNITNDSGEVTSTVKNTYVSNVAFPISNFKGFLPKETYEWAHVTVIFKYHIIDEVKYVGAYVYVDGKAVTEVEKLHKVTTSYPNNICYLTTFRVNNSGSANTSNVSGYDNWQINFFNSAYSLDEIAAHVYNDKYVMPFGKAIASIGANYYDSIENAVNAAAEGDTIKLLADVSEAVNVDKTIIIDRNEYDENGVATGTLFNINCSSTTLVPVEENGVITFMNLQNSSVQIYWDDCPGMAPDGIGYCDCPEGMNDHLMSAFTESAMLNTIPSYPGEIPTFDVVDGKMKKFVGWSYTQGGEAEELKAITSEDCARGWISLYPVYEILEYSITVTAPDGSITYYLSSEWSTAFSVAAPGSTITLIDDVTTGETVSVTKNLTLDLNGYNLRRHNTSISYYNATLDEATGEYVKGELIETVTTGSNDYFFYNTTSGFVFNIKSSRSGSEVSNSYVAADRLVVNGETVKTTVTSTKASGLLSLYPSPATYNIYGDGITFYVSTIVYAEHGVNGNGLKFMIDGGTYIRPDGSNTEGLLTLRRGGSFEINNATFYCNYGYLNRANHNENTTIVYNNCEIINGVIRVESSTDKHIYNNCKIYGQIDNSYNKYNSILGKGTLINFSSPFLVADTGLSLYPVVISDSYNTVYSAVIDNTLDAPKSYSSNEQAVSFSYMVINPATDVATVKWLDEEGKLLATSGAIKGIKATVPSAASIDFGNPYLNRKVNNWLDEEGNVSDLIIGYENEYVFTIAADQGENTEYIAAIKDARLGFIYYSQFNMNLYLPVVEGMDAPTVKSANSTTKDTVLINGAEYWVYTWWCTATKVTDTVKATVDFTVDGISYSQTFSISAIVYANIVLSDPSSNEEALAVANMIRYVKEALILANKSTEACDAIIGEGGLYTLPEYRTEFKHSDIDLSGLEGYVDYFALSVSDGTPEFVFEISDAAISKGITMNNFKITTESGVVLKIFDYANNGKQYQTNNVKVYNANELLNVTITIPAAEEGGEATVVSAQYSLGSYIKGVEAQGQNADLAKALYEFGVAAKAYRDSRTDY